MKIKVPTLWPVLAALFLATNVSYGQVGINTTTPNGILDVNSATYGVVLPRLALTATNVMAPATNPQTGTIPTGTVVYNTNTTTNGEYSVYPGMYVWVVDKWIPQFTNRQAELFNQVGTDFRPRSNQDYENIPFSANTFTAKYTGIYKFEINVNYGGGFVRLPSNAYELNVAAQTGKFRLRFNNGSDVDYFIPCKTISARYRSGGNYYAIWKQQSMVIYISLNRGDTPTFYLSFDQDDNSAFEDSNSNSGKGRGNVGDDIPCTVEITYLGEK
jgi:hypothetical protein